MSEITRRRALGATAALTAASGALGAEAAPTAPAGAEVGREADAPAPKSHRFRLVDVPPRAYSGGTARIANAENFPASPHMSGAIVELRPGGIREPHWHPNAVEWDYVLSGRLKMNVVGPDGLAETFEATAGDIVVFPQGYAHYFENPGPEDASVLLVFNTGKFEEIGVSEWVAQSPKDSFAAVLDLPADALAKAPDRGLFITSRQTPGK